METTKIESVSGIPRPTNLEDLPTDRVLSTPPEFEQTGFEKPGYELSDFEQGENAGTQRQAWGSGLPFGEEPTGGTRSEAEMGPASFKEGSDPSLEVHESTERLETETPASTTSWNPIGQTVAQPAIPMASDVPPMTAWAPATPVPSATMQWPSNSQDRQSSPQDSYGQNATSRTAQSTQTVPASPMTSSGSTNPASPEAKKKSGWIKPALVGGLVGALTSGAILGGVLASTRNSKNDNKQVTQSSVNPQGTPVAAAQAGGTKVVPALAASTGQADVPRIVSELSKSIVTINTKGFPGRDLFGSSQVPEGAGTGIILTKDGFVLTNAHVIADARTIKVTIPGGKTCQADVVGRDRTNDVAVVKCRNVSDFVPAALGKSGEMRVGESVVAIGNALGLEGNPTVTTGILSATERTLEGDGERLTGLLQTDAAINPGNSGGPLVNARGQVVGMNTAIYQNTNNIGFAIPIDSILPIIEKIRSGEIDKPKTFLGVTTQTMDADIQKQYSLGTDKGAIVVDVTVGSPAQNAGLQQGDIITKFDGVSISDNRQLGEQVRKHKAGDVVDMTYLRGSQSISSKVTLGSARSPS
jgi:S1-C subfamily serine protease